MIDPRKAKILERLRSQRADQAVTGDSRIQAAVRNLLEEILKLFV